VKLYHFTCTHAAEQIAKTMVLQPFPQVQLDSRMLVWLTDLESPIRADVGLTSTILHCDRMEYRATVDADAHHWPEYLRKQPRDVRLAARALTVGGGLPMHWYVSRWPVPVLAIGEVT
jgi:hypothetical protein